MAIIEGTEQNDVLSGGGARDTLRGLGGNDTLNGNGENDVLLGGTDEDSLLGGAGADTLEGEGGDDFLSGEDSFGPLNDLLAGGTGNDVYRLGNLGDRVVETAGEGIDSIRVNFDFALPANVENLSTDFTSAARTLTGNALANRINGSSGDDTLDGVRNGKGIFGGDTLTGGRGSDTYRIHSASDVVVERLNEGEFDTIETSVSYETPNHVELLILTGNANINGSSNRNGSNIIGNPGNNLLVGSNEGDIIAGGTGADTIRGGGSGDLLFHAQHGVAEENASFFPAGMLFDGGEGDDAIGGGQGADTIIGGDGNDAVSSGNAFTTPSSELLRVGLSCAAINIFIGAGLQICNADRILDNLLPTIFIAGRDSIEGGAGEDTLGGDLNRDTLRGGDDDDTLKGKGDDDRLFGDAGDDRLDGGAGADTMAGGEGQDVYFVNHENDVVVEEEGGGDDIIVSTVSRTMGEFPEDLTLRGNAKFGGGNEHQNRLEGNDVNNRLRGAGAADTLVGRDGNDRLAGNDGDDRLRGCGGGNEIDTLIGGTGRDTFVLGSRSDRLYDGSENRDYAMLADFRMARSEDAGDILQLRGNESDYVIGSTGVRDGAGLYFDTNGNHRADRHDELLAVTRGLSEQELEGAVHRAQFV